MKNEYEFYTVKNLLKLDKAVQHSLDEVVYERLTKKDIKMLMDELMGELETLTRILKDQEDTI